MFHKRLGVCLTAGIVALGLIVSGCANFPPQRATQTPPPTDTPLPLVAEPTSTPTPLPLPPPTDTATPVVVVSVPTSTPQAMAEVTPTAVPTTASEGESVPTSTPALPPPPPTPVPQPTELLVNGNFEEGFGGDGVAVGWHKFSNGDAAFGWHDDTWDPVVWEGGHSQLLSIVTPNYNDRYVGIYQTVQVVPNQPYELTLHGLVRANTPAEQYGHRLYWGVNYDGSTDWQAVDNWVELSWDQHPLMDDKFSFNDYTTVITPPGKSLTLFIRGHSKWPRQSEADFNLDGLSLRGVPEAGVSVEEAMPVSGRTEINWVPIAALAALLLILFREGLRGIDWWHRQV